MFVDPESLPEMQSPRQYGSKLCNYLEYWVRKFDGNMSETKVEHARILNEEQDKKKFSFRDAIFLSTNTTPRMSRKPSHRSTVSTPWEITEEACNIIISLRIVYERARTDYFRTRKIE